LVGKHEGKKQLEELRLDGRDNIKMGLTERKREGVDWIQVVLDRVQWRALANTVMDLRVS
jgi:hypothetical protein